MLKIIKILFLFSVFLFIISIFQQEKLPDKKEILDEIYQEPIQVETDEDSFETERGGAIYKIDPLYGYELYGLVVSYHDSESWFDYYHKEWKDFINVRDICVIWGENIESEVYKEMKFTNGSFTCYPRFKQNTDSELWQKFESSSLSNNHLLYEDEDIYKAIKSGEKGDQIYLKGYLVEYSHDSFRRGSSLTREDTGCETIYVTDFKILKKGNVIWRNIYTLTKYSMLILFIFLAVNFFFGSDNFYHKNQ